MNGERGEGRERGGGRERWEEREGERWGRERWGERGGGGGRKVGRERSRSQKPSEDCLLTTTLWDLATIEEWNIGSLWHPSVTILNPQKWKLGYWREGQLI